MTLLPEDLGSKGSDYRDGMGLKLSTGTVLTDTEVTTRLNLPKFRVEASASLLAFAFGRRAPPPRAVGERAHLHLLGYFDDALQPTARVFDVTTHLCGTAETTWIACSTHWLFSP